MAICCALLKHGHENFSLIILEYCLVADLLIREKHYQKTLKPEYNISKDPVAPFSGRKHSDASKTQISDAMTGDKNPMFGKTGKNHPMFGQNHSDETKTIMSYAKKGSAARESTRARCAPREESYVW